MAYSSPEPSKDSNLLQLRQFPSHSRESVSSGICVVRFALLKLQPYTTKTSPTAMTLLGAAMRDVPCVITFSEFARIVDKIKPGYRGPPQVDLVRKVYRSTTAALAALTFLMTVWKRCVLCTRFWWLQKISKRLFGPFAAPLYESRPYRSSQKALNSSQRIHPSWSFISGNTKNSVLFHGRSRRSHCLGAARTVPQSRYHWTFYSLYNGR